MDSKIRVLDEHTINKIAAGEVIENPSSVVKELVENSIDAGSDEIIIEIKGGGRQSIRISDNGSGMNPDDALLCFERHATSKIKSVEDILSTHTMGFRGEAIPSIASISKLTLLTCPKGAPEGTLIIVDGGRIINVSPVIRSHGTTFEIKQLFFNVPVRKKFQRSPTYDANEIIKIVSIQALAHPNIKFQLINNQAMTINTNLPTGESFSEKLGERITSILGSEFFSGLTPIEQKINDCQITGFIGLPAYTRQNRTGQYLFINNRAVTSPMVTKAVREGYGTSLATNRHPVYALHLTLPGHLVDVNVHPQKREVRLRQEQELQEMITLAVEEALQKSGLCTFSPRNQQFSFNQSEHEFNREFNIEYPNIDCSDNESETISESAVTTTKFKEFDELSVSECKSYEYAATTEGNFQANLGPTPCIPPVSDSNLNPHSTSIKSPPWTRFHPSQSPSTSPSPQLPLSPPLSPTHIPIQARIHHPTPTPTLTHTSTPSTLNLTESALPTKVIATLQGYLILASNIGNLKLVDQRAAHRRILYEKLQKQNQPFAIQNLLIPYTLELTPLEIGILQENIEELNHLGIKIEEFGHQCFIIQTLPQIWIDANPKKLITEILHDLQEYQASNLIKQEKLKYFAKAAAQAAVSQKQILSLEEGQQLMNQLHQCNLPNQCPFGKPTIIEMTKEDIGKQFEKQVKQNISAGN